MHLLNHLIAALLFVVTSAAVLPVNIDTTALSSSDFNDVAERHIPHFIVYPTPTQSTDSAGEVKPRTDFSVPPMSPARELMLANDECQWTCVKFQCWCLEDNEPIPQNDKNFSEDVLEDIQAHLAAGASAKEQRECGWACFGASCAWICHNADNPSPSELTTINNDKIKARA